MRLPFTSALLLACSATAGAADEPAWLGPLAGYAALVKTIGPEGLNGSQAAGAAGQLGVELPPEAIPRLLEEFAGANPLAANLLRSSVERIAGRAAESSAALPVRDLEAFVGQTDRDPRARRLAYELLASADPAAGERLIPGLLHDPNPELRRDAVAFHVAEADRLKAAGSADARAAYEEALTGAVDDDQVRTLVKALEGYGVKVDIARHFGFVTQWHVAGPFDNRGMKGFAAAYPPEQGFDPAATFEGQLGKVEWKPIATDDPYGVLDIAKQIENHKGSAMYFAAEFDAAAAEPVEIRLGTPNAWKLWLNGEYLFGREEYHRGEELDQYRVPARLAAGRNVILLKVLQNEQTDDWAQSFKFRLRVCDPTGQAVLPAPPG